ncbi:MAG: hypothetical protein K6F05_06950 [Succinivibrio sp.]|nr:hypothetical protein [Succinivibrio sp.]
MFSNLFSGLSKEAIKAALVLSHIEIAHFTEGRIRAVYAPLKQDDAAYAELCSHLDAIAEIDDYTVNRTTGSIVINYDPQKIVPNSFLGHLVDGARKKYARGV